MRAPPGALLRQGVDRVPALRQDTGPQQARQDRGDLLEAAAGAGAAHQADRGRRHQGGAACRGGGRRRGSVSGFLSFWCCCHDACRSFRDKAI